MTTQEVDAEPTRRRFLVRCIQTVQGSIGTTLAFVLGRAALAPAFEHRERLWVQAGQTSSLIGGKPSTVTLRVARSDGAGEIVDRRVIYLIKTSEQEVKAFDSACTHLGCRTRFNAETNQIECPCHGGRYDIAGQVVAGPPPGPLATLSTRLDGDRILVEL